MSRPLATVAAIALALGAAGCGGDADEPLPGRGETAAQPERTAVEETGTERAGTATSPPDRTAPASPEEQPGGAGDEEPARSQALFTGRRGRITPRVVRVPPFLAIRVELRSADGRPYALRFRGKVVRAGGELASSSTTLDGLRPGASVTGTPIGPGDRVRIVASAEPGP